MINQKNNNIINIKEKIKIIKNLINRNQNNNKEVSNVSFPFILLESTTDEKNYFKFVSDKNTLVINSNQNLKVYGDMDIIDNIIFE